MIALLEQAHRENLEREDLRRIEKVTGYFDEYETRHQAMRLLSEAWWKTSDQRLRSIIKRAIDHVRDEALDLIPYSATTPNKTWDGKRA